MECAERILIRRTSSASKNYAFIIFEYIYTMESSPVNGQVDSFGGSWIIFIAQ